MTYLAPVIKGMTKILQKLRLNASWMGMFSDVTEHCMKCTVCQQAKLPTPAKVPLLSLPMDSPWEMLAVDILEVPLSTNGNHYLLVVQDYFTKWADAFPKPDQMSRCITNILINLCARMGLPRIIHSDLGRNFESTIQRYTICKLLELWSIQTDQFFKCYVHM